jgi:hypothetical protein
MTAPGPAVVVPGEAATSVPQQASPPPSDTQPSISPGEQVSPERTFQKPANGAPLEAQPAPGGDTESVDPYGAGESDNSTYFQAPRLFDPNDRTAQRAIAPVMTALYEKPVAYRSAMATPISLKQAQRDAVGWTSASE